MELPLIYVRSDSKGHGLQNQIEGVVQSGTRVVVIEDLISTGMSSLKAVDALRAKGCHVAGMVAIFTYGFEYAKENFRNYACPLYTLSDYDTMIEVAAEEDYINQGGYKLTKKLERKSGKLERFSLKL